MADVISDLPTSSYQCKLTPKQGQDIYIQLRKEVVEAGILKRSYGYYAALIATDLIGFFAAGYFVITLMNPLLLIGAIMSLAFFSVHIGGLIHDAGHRAIFASTRANELAGTLFSAIITFPFSTWKENHNAHHANTNVQGEDPDLEIPFVFTEDEYRNKGGLVRFIRRYQAWLYYPLGSLVSITYRTKAFVYYVKNLHNPRIAIEAGIMAVGVSMWFVAPFMFFPLWKAVLFFVLYNETAGFLMLNVFAPNHKGMPQLAPGTSMSFLEQQVVTSRNLHTNPLIDYVYLGLNNQIEHHLFPNCARNKLKLIRPYVQSICKEHGLDYISMGPLESNISILKDLHEVSIEARQSNQAMH